MRHGPVRSAIAGEMTAARRVQKNLLPNGMVHLRTLQYAGRCLQAGAVGGDYFDFIPLAHNRMAIVLADISGKGVSAALLMANLQALIRSQCALEAMSLCSRLRVANRLFHESSAPEHYATLFYGEYDDRTGHMQYVNCGHNPPLILRSNGVVEWLVATAPVLGILRAWSCEMGRVTLDAGDLLTVFSDGIVEARNRSDEEFGAARLVGVIRQHWMSPCRLILSSLLETVRAFSNARQDDDQTAIVARRIA